MSSASQLEEPGGVHFLLDRNGEFLDIGDGVEKLTGFKKEEAIGQNFRLFVNPQDQPTIFLNFQNIANGIPQPPCEFRIMTVSGDQILVKTSASAVMKNSEVVGIEGTFVKI
jgi:PAS domain S-box-containing protein